MPRRGIRIKINPHNRFDLSHLTRDEGAQALHHFLHDLCFWGPLPSPLTRSSSTAPYYYHIQFQENERLIRQQSSGSDSKSRGSRSRECGSKGKNAAAAPSSHRGKERPPRTHQTQGRWKTAVDPSTGQTYYYDPATRQTQWEKVRGSKLSLECAMEPGRGFQHVYAASRYVMERADQLFLGYVRLTLFSAWNSRMKFVLWRNNREKKDVNETEYSSQKWRKTCAHISQKVA